MRANKALREQFLRRARLVQDLKKIKIILERDLKKGLKTDPALLKKLIKSANDERPIKKFRATKDNKSAK